MTSYDLPENYRELQKLAGEIEGASGKGTKDEIIESIQEAPEENVKQAIEVGNEDEKEESSDKEKDNSSNQEDKASEVEESREDEPELEYSADRDHEGDLFGREDPEETLEASENEDGEVVLGSDEEKQEKSGDEEPSDPENDHEPVELQTDIFRDVHLAINQVLSKLLQRKGLNIEPLSEKDLERLERNTEVVVDEKLEHGQKRKLQERSGLVGMIIPHASSVVRGMFKDDKEETDQETEDSEDTPEHLQRDRNQEEQAGEGPKHGKENPFGK